MKLNPAQKITQSESLLLEQRLHRLYRDAWLDTLEESDKFWKMYEKQIRDKYTAYQEGKISQQDYWGWVNGHKKMGKRIDNLSASIADRMTNTGAIASSYINNTTPKIFAESANYEAFTIEGELKGAVSFSLIDDEALKAVIEGNSTEFKAKWKNTFTDPPKIYNWSYSKVQDAMYQGILKGESVTKIANRIQSITESNKAIAVRNARTAITSAYNQGQMATFERAAKKGIVVEKEWIATSDARTRDSHADLDGVRVHWDEEFPNGLMCPGDPKGAPEEVYNCRCTMARVPLAETNQNEFGSVDENTGRLYSEWKKDNINSDANNERGNYTSNLSKELDNSNIAYRTVYNRDSIPDDQEIIDFVGGYDPTPKGACASQALAYIGNKAGYIVKDYRGGTSRTVIANPNNIESIAKLNGVKSKIIDDPNRIQAVHKLLDGMEYDKEYLLATGKHVAIVKKFDNEIGYLELQGRKNNNKYYKLDDSQLYDRFHVNSKKCSEKNILIDTETLYNNKEFKYILGYINTAVE